jgi:hypothetical protein
MSPLLTNLLIAPCSEQIVNMQNKLKKKICANCDLHSSSHSKNEEGYAMGVVAMNTLL